MNGDDWTVVGDLTVAGDWMLVDSTVSTDECGLSTTTGTDEVLGSGRSVTVAGRNCSLLNTFRSSGQTPAVLNPDIIFTGVAAFSHGSPISCAIWYIVTVCPG